MDPPEVFRQKFLHLQFKVKDKYTEKYLEQTEVNVRDYEKEWEKINGSSNFFVSGNGKYQYTFTEKTSGNELKSILEKQKKLYLTVKVNVH